MRTLVIITVIILFAFIDANAQYSFNKTKYDSRDYTYQKGDPFHPVVCGVASYFLPGLGQIIAGETGRGLLFTGAYAGSLIIFLAGAVQNFESNFMNPDPGNEGVGLMAVGGTATVVTMVWSVADAVKVAKINNLAYRDRKGTAYQLQLVPYYATNTQQIPGRNFGATFKLNF